MNSLPKALMGAITAVGVMAAVPAQAAPSAHAPAPTPASAPAHGYHTAEQSADFHKKRKHRDRRYAREDQRVNSNTRVWRGDDGRYRCKKDNGTTGLLIGGAVGGLAGNEIAGRGDKLLGTVIGAGAGALIGREIDRDKYRCR